MSENNNSGDATAEALNVVENSQLKPFDDTPEIESGEDSEEGSEETLQATPQSKKAEEAKIAKKVDEKVKAELRKYKLKIDGKEVELDENEVVRRAQLSSGAEKRMQEAAQVRKEVAQLVKMLKEDPESVLTDPAIGVDAVKFAQKILNRQLEEEQKPAEVREKEKLEKELAKLREEYKKAEESRKKEEMERYMVEQERQMEHDIQEAINSSGLPKKPAVLKKMADIMLSFLDKGQEITPAQAVKLAKKELVSDLRELMDASPDDYLEELLGKNGINRVKAKYAPKVKRPAPVTASSIKSSGNGSNGEVNRAEKKISVKDWLRGK